jgi:hypothetical protein
MNSDALFCHAYYDMRWYEMVCMVWYGMVRVDLHHFKHHIHSYVVIMHHSSKYDTMLFRVLL